MERKARAKSVGKIRGVGDDYKIVFDEAILLDDDTIQEYIDKALNKAIKEQFDQELQIQKELELKAEIEWNERKANERLWELHSDKRRPWSSSPIPSILQKLYWDWDKHRETVRLSSDEELKVAWHQNERNKINFNQMSKMLLLDSDEKNKIKANILNAQTILHKELCYRGMNYVTLQETDKPSDNSSEYNATDKLDFLKELREL